jgi:hypothetical protein
MKNEAVDFKFDELSAYDKRELKRLNKSSGLAVTML